MSVIAFHEKAGRSQVGSVVSSLDKVLLPPSFRCRHPSIRTLDERFCSLGASWVFSFQPVLPPDCRPRFHLSDGSWARRLTQSPELGIGAFCFSFPRMVWLYAAIGIALWLLFPQGFVDFSAHPQPM